MSETKRNALVVDDEAQVRDLTARALAREGFPCDAAVDGSHASRMIQSKRYDVVVTDLKMPKRSGYDFACELLGREERPVVAILTGMVQPQIARELMVRGADYFELKPVDYVLFAARVRSLVPPRQQEQSDGHRNTPPLGSGSSESSRPSDSNRSATTSSSSNIEHLLVRQPRKVSPSEASLKVYLMASSEQHEVPAIAAAVEHDPLLRVDVLQLANDTLPGTPIHKIVDVQKAIVRLGRKRVAALALERYHRSAGQETSEKHLDGPCHHAVDNAPGESRQRRDAATDCRSNVIF